MTEDSINKQLGDKERVAAALENGHLLEVVNKCVAGSDHVAPDAGSSSSGSGGGPALVAGLGAERRGGAL